MSLTQHERGGDAFEASVYNKHNVKPGDHSAVFTAVWLPIPKMLNMLPCFSPWIPAEDMTRGGNTNKRIYGQSVITQVGY